MKWPVVTASRYAAGATGRAGRTGRRSAPRIRCPLTRLSLTPVRSSRSRDAVNEPGSLYWCELYTPDEDAAYRFYSSVFGWEATSMPMPDGSGTYRMVNPAGQGAEGMFGGFVPIGTDPAESDTRPHWLLYFAVTDCDATVTVARKLGGRVRVAPTDIEGVGRFAKLADPYGARFALMQGVEQGG